ncbi:MAG TPA: hypothetical protein VN611_12600 [Patescibacteria group bacterium]|nr:hypothetical protein [Patescibacteria group bacterium]
MPNVRQAYRFALREIVRRPVYWTLVSLLSFAILLVAERPGMELLAPVIYLTVFIGISQAALKAGIGYPYGIRDLLPGWRKGLRCWLLILLCLPFFLAFLYIVIRVTGLSRPVLTGSVTECVFELIFYRFSFAWFYLLSTGTGIRDSMQLSWDSIRPNMAPGFCWAILLSYLLSLPGLIADWWLGCESGVWANLLVPVISSLAFANLFQQVHCRGVTAGDADESEIKS